MRSQQLPAYGAFNPRLLAERINNIAKGRGDNYGRVTLTASATTTTVNTGPAINVSENSSVILFPMSANAASELGAGTLYVSAVANGSFTLTHANAGSTDRTFAYVFIG